MNGINFYKLWHQELTSDAQIKVPGTFINLESIICSTGLEKLWPFLQEYRVHFADLDLSEDYVGFCSASLSDKFHPSCSQILTNRLEYQDFKSLDLSPIVISQKNWIHQATVYHVGMDKYIHHYLKLADIDEKFLKGEIPYCNSFICSKEVYIKSREIFRKNIFQIFEDYNYSLDFTDGGYGPIRKGGCLCERLWGITLKSQSQKFTSGITGIMWRNMVQ